MSPVDQQCEALFDFAGASQEDLPFKKGETLVIKNTSEDPNWWLAQNKHGKVGMIPANYVELNGNQATAKDKAVTLPRDASGNVAVSAIGDGSFTLCVSLHRVHHGCTLCLRRPLQVTPHLAPPGSHAPPRLSRALSLSPPLPLPPLYSRCRGSMARSRVSWQRSCYSRDRTAST